MNSMDMIDPAQEVRKHLNGLLGIEYEEGARGSFVLTISDKSLWNSDENILRLAPLFAPLVMREYAGKEYDKSDLVQQKEVCEQLRITFHNADKIFVEAHPGGIGAFSSVERALEDDSVGIVRDIVTDRASRGIYFFKLFRDMCSDESLRALIGESANPVVIKTAQLVGNRHGHDVFFGDQGVERVDIQTLHEINKAYLERDGFLVRELDPGYFLVTSNFLPQLSPDDTRVASDDILYPAIQHLLALQDKNSDGTVTGSLALVLHRK